VRVRPGTPQALLQEEVALASDPRISLISVGTSMRRLPIYVFVLLGVLLAGGAAAGYAYDASRGDLIAQGVSVGGTDVGGLRANRARMLLDERLARPLQRPLRVRVGKRSFALSAERARIRTDVDGMVGEALARSRAGDPVSRIVRDARGERLDVDIPLRVTYSRRAVRGLVRRVKRSVDRSPKDARVEFAATRLERIPGRMGRKVPARPLERRIHREIVRPDADRLVRTRARPVAPEVTTRTLASRYPAVITVDRSNHTLRFWRGLELERTYRIAVGQAGLETPAGLYHVQNKAVDPAWQVPDSDWAGELRGKLIPGGTDENPLKARWMGIYDGAGIHGTDDVASLGTNASHGCIRMAVPEVKELYEKVPVRAPVYIA
jgi:lipoprotein-anchoring transpeptidase ErfK/SrfK